MHFRERNEIIMFNESSPEKKQELLWVKKIFERIILCLCGIYYSHCKVGSERWHIVQDKLSISPSVGIYSKKRILFYTLTLPKCGSDLYVHPNFIVYFPQNIEIKDNVYFNRGVFITARATVTIGRNVLIGPYTVINSANHIYSNKNVPIYLQGHVAAPIVIEDDVWIGANVTILKGVTIGKGAVIGAGSTVTKNVLPYTVVGGVPAKEIKKRD